MPGAGRRDRGAADDHGADGQEADPASRPLAPAVPDVWDRIGVCVQRPQARGGRLRRRRVGQLRIGGTHAVEVTVGHVALRSGRAVVRTGFVVVARVCCRCARAQFRRERTVPTRIPSAAAISS